MLLQNPLPAIMIGGPPHSGKSVLAYNLTQRLRTLRIDHYLLRACPDGEGDWSYETAAETVRTLRHKGTFTDNFVTNVIEVLNRRMMPLLVDVGGRPQPDQEAILAACSHAILIAGDRRELDRWRELTERLQLPIIAELHSSLGEGDRIDRVDPILQARIHGLERGARVNGPTFQQLTGLVRALLATKPQALRAFHLAHAPVETTVDLERLLHTLHGQVDEADGTGRESAERRWAPADLPALLNYLPKTEPLALYGRSANWVYSAVASYTEAAAFYQFDARLGWVEPMGVHCADEAGVRSMEGRVQSTIHDRGAYSVLDLRLTDPYLEHAPAHPIRLPRLPTTKGMVISGRIPLWLLTGIVRAYRHLPWLAVYQPPLHGAVTVHSTRAEQPVGGVMPFVFVA